MEAASQEEVVTRLLQGGLVPVSIIMSAQTLDAEQARSVRVRVSRKERRLFTRQLASLLRAKTELVPAVGVLRDQSAGRAVRLLLEDVERHMREGNAFSESVARHPRVFSPLFVSAIRAGEAAGKLDDILLKLVEFDDQQEQLESRFKGALAYPILLLIVGLACLGFFIGFVVPRMASLFEQLGGALPWPTRLLTALSGVLSHQWPWVLAALAALGVLIRLVVRSPQGRSLFDRGLRFIPWTRDLLEARQVGRFTRTLQLMLHSGLPVFQAMEIARPTLNSALLETRMREVQEHVKRGESIAESLRAVRGFPPLMTHMVAIGESAGTLVDVLHEVASYYERLLDEMLRLATSLLEPLMIVLMGVLVGFCVLAMVLPVFQMTQLVR